MAVDDECKLKFLELKAKRNYRFILLRIENQSVVVAKLGNPDKTYEDFTVALPANECRYAVFDFDFTTIENCQKSKIFFIAWAPDIAKVREKMVYASSKDRFKRELDGIQVELQATDPSYHFHSFVLNHKGTRSVITYSAVIVILFPNNYFH